MTPSLARLRASLTLWYLSTIAVMLIVLGGGLFVAIRHQFSRQLDASLREATAALERAARTREFEAGARGHVVDAVQELRISDRTLVLFDSAGRPAASAAADAWMVPVAMRAMNFGSAHGRHRDHGTTTVRWYAERFALSSGARMVALAAATQVDLDARYAGLIVAFGGAAACAVLLVALGGWVLVRRSTAPVEDTMHRMRQFMADAAHELRTPVTVLRTQAEVALARPRSDAEYTTTLRMIETESRRAGRIVDDLLVLARADSGDRPPLLERLFLDDVVADAVTAAAPLALSRRVELTVGAFQETAVDGDGEMLRRLVMILLDNAIKFTPAGGRVTVGIASERGSAVVTVQDTGAGIAPDVLPHVFERFYRGDPARSRDSAGGTGLGLAIARWIAESHRGTVTLTSDGVRGTTATIRIPLATEMSSR